VCVFQAERFAENSGFARSSVAPYRGLAGRFAHFPVAYATGYMLPSRTGTKTIVLLDFLFLSQASSLKVK
jgi:hypothetical protein